MNKPICNAAMAIALLAPYGFGLTAEDDSIDNGTNPTKLSRKSEMRFKHSDLGQGFTSGLLEFSYSHPIDQRSALAVLVPVTRVAPMPNNDYALGDVEIKYAHLAELNRAYGIVLGAALAFDTADRRELGAGQAVFEGTAAYVRFLDHGIFGPTLAHSIGLGGLGDRKRVSTTTMDFYYVPKLSNPDYFMTYDPALTQDWANHKTFGSLAITLGGVLGPAWGGRSMMYIKPQIFAGRDRPADWSVQVGYRVIGF